ncbi:hypothetical protein SLEP1_g32185 [Rubroshorea leprosula]|uniref:Uncharacterized protein n=1 Tax=Rubroshorea leprosula TaxID=152421 RepID=A0AAV5KCJ4_9ROSI|nr:hypothetical protein SLEP1_g32185 [Rubroshorea leprosula]
MKASKNEIEVFFPNKNVWKDFVGKEEKEEPAGDQGWKTANREEASAASETDSWLRPWNRGCRELAPEN